MGRGEVTFSPSLDIKQILRTQLRIRITLQVSDPHRVEEHTVCENCHLNFSLIGIRLKTIWQGSFRKWDNLTRPEPGEQLPDFKSPEAAYQWTDQRIARQKEASAS